MSARSIAFHPEASLEAEAAITWYAARSARAAGYFFYELERSLSELIKAPERYPLFEGDARKCALRRFPYSVIYVAYEDHIEVLAIAHGRRRPGYWRTRTD